MYGYAQRYCWNGSGHTNLQMFPTPLRLCFHSGYSAWKGKHEGLLPDVVEDQSSASIGPDQRLATTIPVSLLLSILPDDPTIPKTVDCSGIG